MTKSACYFAVASVALGAFARADDSTPLPTPQKASPPSLTVIGTREEDYRVDAVASIGPLGSSNLLDVPYSVSVLPFDLIEKLPGSQLQRRVQISAPHRVSRATGSRYFAAADPRHAGRQLSEHASGRHDHVHHRRDGLGTISTD